MVLIPIQVFLSLALCIRQPNVLARNNPALNWYLIVLRFQNQVYYTAYRMATSTVGHQQSAMVEEDGSATATTSPVKCETQNKTVTNDARLRIVPESHDIDSAPPRRAIPVLCRIGHTSHAPLRLESKARASAEESHDDNLAEGKWTAIKIETGEQWIEVKIAAEAEASNTEDNGWQIV